MIQFYKTKKSLQSIVFSFVALGALLLLNLGKVQAQAPTISYPTAAADLIRSYSQSSLTVKLVFNAVCSGTNTVRVALPASVTYVSAAAGGGVTKTGGIGSVTIAESSIADLSNPVFSISGIAAIGDEITFTVARRAGCGSLATAKDSVYFVAGAGCSDASEVVGTVNTYNIFAPALSITPAAGLTGAVVGSTYSRTTVVTNGGNGPTDTVRFYIVYPGGGIVNNSGTNAITANGVSFTPSSSSGDTLFYKFFGATIFGGDNILTSGETVTIVEPIRVVTCNTSTTYGTRWGRDASTICQTATGTSSMTMAVGVPILTTSIVESTILSPCTPGSVTITISNTGSGASAGAMFNLISNLGNFNPNVTSVIFGPSNLLGNNSSANVVFNNFRINGSLVTVVQTGTNPWQINMNQFSTDPDGAGVGLADIDGDGEFDDLAPGSSLVITMNREYVNSASCVVPDYYRTIGSQSSFTTMCGTAVTPLPSSGGTVAQNTSASVTPTLPTLVAGGVPFTIRVCKNGFNSQNFSIPTDSFYIEMNLPSGLSYVSGTARYNNGAATVTTSGSTLYISGKGGNRNFCFNADFVYACGTSTTLSIPYTVYNVLDRSCGAIEYFSCASMSLNAKCPTPCPTGIANYNPTAVRLNYGWTNTNMTDLVNPTTLSSFQRRSLTVYDTLRIIQPGIQNGTYTNAFYRYELNKASAADVLSFRNGTFNYIASGTSTVVSCPLPALTNLSSPTKTIWVWNLTSLLGGGCGIPASLAPGDSIWVDMVLNVTNANSNGLYASILTSPPGQLSYMYNLDVSSVEQYCDQWAPDFYLMGLGYSPTAHLNASATNLTGCTSGSQNFVNFFGSTNEPGAVFLGEYRPTVSIDSIVITFPPGLSWNGATPTMNVDTFFATTFTRANFIQSAPAIQRGNQLVLINPGTWKFNDMLPGTFVSRHNVTFQSIASCATLASGNNFSVTTYGKNFVYAGLNTPFVSSYTSAGGNGLSANYNIATKPNITVQNNTGTVQGVNVSQSWDVQINSTGTVTAPYVWMALEKATGSGGIVVDSVKLLPSLTTVVPTSTYNTTDKWYQISMSGLASGASQQARVFFHYSSCMADSIMLKSGWNCSGYPSPDPLSYPCTGSSTFLKIDPQSSQVQLSVLRQPGGGIPINLCSVDSALIVLNSAQAANLVSPYVTFYPPSGVTLMSPIKVEYPRGSGDYQNATVTSLPGGGYQIDLSAHTSIGTAGIFGTANASPSYVPLGGDREAKIKLDFTTNCDYVSGSTFSFNAYGNRPCGAAAIDNGVSGTTIALNIIGATATGGAGLSISFSGAPSSVGCGSTAVTLSLVTTPTGSGTSLGDTMIYTLPIGMGYAGNLSPGLTAIVSGGAGAPTQVKLALPTGIAPATPINYSFDVVPSGAGCGSVNISAIFKRLIAPLTCGVGPGSFTCASSSVVIASATSPNITLVKPSLSISNVSLMGATAWVQANYFANFVKVYYNNTGTQALTANVDTVEFFCGSSTVPFAKMPLTKNISIGASDSDQYNIMMPIGSCSLGDVVTAKIQTTTAAGTEQCLCAGASYLMAGFGLPLEFLSATATSKACAVTIDWTYNKTSEIAKFAIERSSNGSQYTTVASHKATATNYVDVTPNAGTWLYRIKAIGVNGESKYSSTMQVNTNQCAGSSVSVYPNPANEQLNIVLQGAAEISSYQLVDALGRTILKGALQANNNNKLDVSAIAQGVYVLKVIVDGNATIQQVQIAK